MYHDAYQVYELLDKWNPRGPPDVNQVEALFQRTPGEARREFLFGQTLLHKCMEYFSTQIDLVQVLIVANPSALTKPDDNGFLPIHRALISGSVAPSLMLIQLMIQEAPEIILESTPSGTLPLHLACARFETPSTFEIVKFLVDLFPDAIQHRHNQGMFPLNHALGASDPQEEIIELLIKQYPVLLSFMDDEGLLPLHRILKHRRARYDKIVDLLVAYCPGALRFQDWKDGQTPLLQACQDNNSLSQIYTLVRKWPEQVTVSYAPSIFLTDPPSFNGEMLPSALASQSATLQRLEIWLTQQPDAGLAVDLQGRSPLHYAALSSSEDASEMVQYLLEHAQKMIAIASHRSHETNRVVSLSDHHGRLPLHYAAAAANTEIVEMLIEVYPDGLIHQDQDGRLPWHYAECARQDLVYDRTLELFPEAEIGDLELVPEEIRWDLIQIAADVIT